MTCPFLHFIAYNYFIFFALFFQVRAYSDSVEIYSDSESVPVTTYPLPNNITLVKAYPYALNISWNSSLGAKYVQ